MKANPDQGAAAVLIALVLLAFAFCPRMALAQTTVPGYVEQLTGNTKNGIGVTSLGGTAPAPSVSTSTPTNGTVSVANTYQSILAASTTRKGCLLQVGANPILVFPGAPGSATTSTSLIVGAYGTFSCASGSTTIGDQLSITATTLPATYTLWVQ